jgi:tRNA pseudouridine55 synthase
MNGLLHLDKPAGWTSRDAVNRIQRLAKPAKVGHAGTLDPLATGVLVICVGQATRLIEYVQRQPKQYLGTFRLGVTSASDDTELELTAVPDAPIPAREAIEAALPQFVGEIQQRPPAYSAIKVDGRRAYDSARRGELMELAPRPVTIYSIELVRYEYPELVLDVRCGSGTYIRSLGRDLAESLGTGAVMSALVRTAIGDFRLETAAKVDEVLAGKLKDFLQPPLTALANLPRFAVTTDQAIALRQGKFMELPELDRDTLEYAAIDDQGELVAIVIPRHSVWGPKLVFAPG